MPTPLHSPGGPQYEDLPPSYDFALSDARNGVASLDASQIEAHRVSANEGPDEPEVWEYRMRDEATEGEETLEQAPAYEGHVPVQHVSNSENIPVGRVQGFTSPPGGNANAPAYDDPPHSIPGPGPIPPSASSSARGQPGTPFLASGSGPYGTPSHGPFGAPGNGPFGPPDHGPFGRGHGIGHRGHRGRGRHGRGARASSSQDWANFGQSMGRWGEEFGRQMGNWGEQFGRQAGAMGEQIGRQAEAMGQQLSRGPGGPAAAYNGPATTIRATTAAGPSSVAPSKPPQYDEPPSYEKSREATGQESGVLHTESKSSTSPPEKVPQSPSEKPSAKHLSNKESDDLDNDDDDSSSISSDSSDSSTSSDSDNDEYDHAQAAYLKRIDSINRAAEAAALKGRKSGEEIEHERELAVAKATREKESAEYKYARKQSRRTHKRELRNKKRELTREYRQRKRDIKEKAQSDGKGKGKAKKGADWKQLKREYKAKRRVLKRERMDAKRKWKMERREEKRGHRVVSGNIPVEHKMVSEKA